MCAQLGPGRSTSAGSGGPYDVAMLFPGVHRAYRWFLPELRRFGDDVDCASALEQAWRVEWVRVAIASVALFAPIAVAFLFLIPIVSAMGAWRWPTFVLFGLAWGCAPVLSSLLCRHRLRRALRSQLVRRGIPLCIDCGYDLNGLRSRGKCPECGVAYCMTTDDM